MKFSVLIFYCIAEWICVGYICTNHGSNSNVCCGVQPVLLLLADAFFRFQFPLFLARSAFQAFLFGGNQLRLGPSLITTASYPLFSIFSDPTRTFPPHVRSRRSLAVQFLRLSRQYPRSLWRTLRLTTANYL